MFRVFQILFLTHIKNYWKHNTEFVLTVSLMTCLSPTVQYLLLLENNISVENFSVNTFYARLVLRHQSSFLRLTVSLITSFSKLFLLFIYLKDCYNSLNSQLILLISISVCTSSCLHWLLGIGLSILWCRLFFYPPLPTPNSLCLILELFCLFVITKRKFKKKS